MNCVWPIAPAHDPVMEGASMCPRCTMVSALNNSPRKNVERRGSHASVASAWNMGTLPVTRPYLDGVPVNELRQLELAITPHGFLKAALASKDTRAIKIQYIGASDFGLSQFGRWVTMVQFTFLGKYSIVGTINDLNLVELVGTWFPNPVYGDMDYEMRYTEYKDFGGVKFPMLLHTHQGDPRLNVAHNYYEYRVTSVKPNAPVTTMPVPEVVKSAVTPPAKVESQQLANGVWLLGGRTHNSLLVEFRAHGTTGVGVGVGVAAKGSRRPGLPRAVRASFAPAMPCSSRRSASRAAAISSARSVVTVRELTARRSCIRSASSRPIASRCCVVT